MDWNTQNETWDNSPFNYLKFLFLPKNADNSKLQCIDTTTIGNLGVRCLCDKNSQHIKDVNIKIVGEDNLEITDKTNQDGYIEFKNLKAGNYKITASKTGFTTQTQNIQVVNNKTQLANMVLAFNSQTISVQFIEDTNSVYGFDDYTDPNIPWKSVEVGITDTFKAKITPPNLASSVDFKSLSPDKVEVSPTTASSDNQIVTIKGIKKGESEIQAIDSCGNVLGNIKVKVYEKITKTVAVRLVHETNYKSTDISDSDIKDYLKKVYNQAVCEFKLTRLPEKTVAFDFNNDRAMQVDTTWMSTEMEKIKEECKDDSYDYNVFLVDNPSRNILGCSTYNQRYAFVHVNKTSTPGKTFAHELGHAAFGFPDNNTAPYTDNIMHQGVGNNMWRLFKDQWDTINP